MGNMNQNNYADTGGSSTRDLMSPVEPCPNQHWFEFKLLRQPRLKELDWWPKQDEEDLPYKGESFNATTPNSSEQGKLDAQGKAHFSPLPNGTGSVSFPKFYEDIDKWLEEQLK